MLRCQINLLKVGPTEFCTVVCSTAIWTTLSVIFQPLLMRVNNFVEFGARSHMSVTISPCPFLTRGLLAEHRTEAKQPDKLFRKEKLLSSPSV